MEKKFLMHHAAVNFVKGQLKEEKKGLYEEWLSELPAGWFEVFITNGLVPFLARFGYALDFSLDEQVKILRGWAFAHVQIQRLSGYHNSHVTLLRCAHSGGDEEFDWYCHTISPLAWETFAKKWAHVDFLDESDPGHHQRMDLPRLVWHMISLNKSRTHRVWLEILQDCMEQDDFVHEDSCVAFTGNRRTFS
jgi:hypothetical protein